MLVHFIKNTHSVDDFACSQKSFEILCYVLEKAELDTRFKRDGPLTLFAPSNRAFERLGEEKVAELLEDPAGELRDILKYHTSDRIYFEEDLFCDRKIDTLLGDSSDDFTTTKCGDRGRIFQVGNGNDIQPLIVATDIVTCNGVAHVIDNVILPRD